MSIMTALPHSSFTLSPHLIFFLSVTRSEKRRTATALGLILSPYFCDAVYPFAMSLLLLLIFVSRLVVTQSLRHLVPLPLLRYGPSHYTTPICTDSSCLARDGWSCAFPS